jgi:DNA-binding GntR family transcriptional regulator
LKQQAYLRLKAQILCGELVAGAVLSVRQLAARLDMSRTPVHAAIERLEADGLVTLAPQQGVVVREMSIQDIANHYEIRQAIEPFVMQRLAGRLSAEQVDQLRVNQSRHRVAAQRRQIAELIEADAEFHQLLCSFLGNREITLVMQHLRDKVQHVIFRVAQQFPDRVSESYTEHEAIFEALLEGDGRRAAELANEHLEQGRRRFWPDR